MDDLDRRLLDVIQAEIPLLPRPFAAVGAAVDLAEREVLARLERLKHEGILRQISAIWDTARLGYQSSLVAASVAPERLEAAAAVVSGHPGVSHNYERDFHWNLWFTLAVPPDSRLGLERTAAHLAARAGLDRYRLLPALRVFKIGVRLYMEETVAPARREHATGSQEAAPGVRVLDEPDRAVVRMLQEPFPLIPEPCAALAAGSGLGVDEVLERARRLAGCGALRRVAGVLHHRRAGFTANAMGVWVVPEERIEETGAAIASFRAVTHCYRRPTYPDWPYSLLSMVHGRSREECLEILDAIATATSVESRATLWSLREFKKVRLRYFTPEYAAWERAA
ncbi:MAG: AsnC family transcriptional regulator [candidate division NC10 bacterium]